MAQQIRRQKVRLKTSLRETPVAWRHEVACAWACHSATVSGTKVNINTRNAAKEWGRAWKGIWQKTRYKSWYRLIACVCKSPLLVPKNIPLLLLKSQRRLRIRSVGRYGRWYCIAPGQNINCDSGHAIFEATHRHGSHIAGKDAVNPCRWFYRQCEYRPARSSRRYRKGFEESFRWQGLPMISSVSCPEERRCHLWFCERNNGKIQTRNTTSKTMNHMKKEYIIYKLSLKRCPSCKSIMNLPKIYDEAWFAHEDGTGVQGLTKIKT